MLALASGALVEVLRRVLGRDHSDLENDVVAGGPYSGDGPPLEERANPNPFELRDFTLHDPPRDGFGVRGDVVVRRERDLARAAEPDGEIARGLVHGVAQHGGRRQETHRKAVVRELYVSL